MVYKKDYRRGKKKKQNWFYKYSLTTWIIIFTSVISVGAFFLFAASESYLNYLALNPSSILQGNYIWTLITHIFIHGSIGHLVINMFVLYSLGGLSEKIIGRKRFFLFYLISGIFAGLLSVILSGFFGYGFWESVFGGPNTYMVGASGAIFAIAGLFVVLLPKIRFAIIFLPFFSLPGWVMVPLVLIITWVASVWANLPIGNAAHFGGFLAGLVFGGYLRYKYKRKVQILQRYFK